MPKKMDFPLASLSTCLKIADSVFKLGGSCSKEKCAKKLGKTVGGGFQSLLASSVKYNLIKNAKNQLTVTDLYRQIHFSYSEEEKKSFMVKAFQNVPLYHSLLNKTFPYETLSRKDLAKRLVKEYGVEDQKANRVAGLFLKDIQCLNFNRDTEQNNDPQTQAAGYSGQWNKKEEEREASLLLCQNEKGIERERETKKMRIMTG